MDVLWGWIQVGLALLIILLTGALIVAGLIANWQLRAQRLRRNNKRGQLQPAIRPSKQPIVADQPGDAGGSHNAEQSIRE